DALSTGILLILVRQRLQMLLDARKLLLIRRLGQTGNKLMKRRNALRVTGKSSQRHVGILWSGEQQTSTQLRLHWLIGWASLAECDVARTRLHHHCPICPPPAWKR